MICRISERRKTIYFLYSMFVIYFRILGFVNNYVIRCDYILHARIHVILFLFSKRILTMHDYIFCDQRWQSLAGQVRIQL